MVFESPTKDHRDGLAMSGRGPAGFSDLHQWLFSSPEVLFIREVPAGAMKPHDANAVKDLEWVELREIRRFVAAHA